MISVVLIDLAREESRHVPLDDNFVITGTEMVRVVSDCMNVVKHRNLGGIVGVDFEGFEGSSGVKDIDDFDEDFDDYEDSEDDEDED